MAIGSRPGGWAPGDPHAEPGLSVPACAAPGNMVTCLEDLSNGQAWQTIRAKKDGWPAIAREVDPIADVERLDVIMVPTLDDLTEAMGVLNPAVVRGRDGVLSFGCLHRPMTGADRRSNTQSHLATLPSSIWLSWVPVADVQRDIRALTRLRHHHLLLTPEYFWEQMKLGAGTPPILTRLGWLVFHHGVQSACRGALAGGATLPGPSSSTARI